jgi:eukaryotic translation initiation factor 2C
MAQVDISTGMMFKSGRLLDLSLECLGMPAGRYTALSPDANMPDSARLRLRHFLMGVRVQVEVDAKGQPTGDARPINGLSTFGAAKLRFALREGGK